jgi:hypothetical protein
MRDEVRTDKDKPEAVSSFRLLSSSFPKRRVSPGERGFASSDANPGTNGATY